MGSTLSMTALAIRGEAMKKKKQEKKPSLLEKLRSSDAVRSYGALGLGAGLSGAIRGYGEKGEQGFGPVTLPFFKGEGGEKRYLYLMDRISRPIKEKDALPILQDMYNVRDFGKAYDAVEKGIWANISPKYYNTRATYRPLNDKKVRDLFEIVREEARQGAEELKKKSLKERLIRSDSSLNDYSFHKLVENALENKDSQTPESMASFKDLSDRVERFVSEKKLREGGLKINLRPRKSPVPAGYDVLSHTVELNRNNPYLALQQVAKASDLKGNVAKSYLRSLPLLASGIAVPFAMRNADTVREANPDGLDARTLSFIKDHPVATGLSGYGASILYPEAKASYLSLRQIAKDSGRSAAFEAAKKFYGPHLAKYTLGAVPFGLGILGAKKLLEKKDGQEKRAYKDAFSQWPVSPWPDEAALKNIKDFGTKAFWSGFASGALPTFLTLSYLHGTKGGRAIQKKEGKEPPAFFKGDPLIASAVAGATAGIISGRLSQKGALSRMGR